MDKKEKEGLAILVFIFLAVALARCGWEAGGEFAREAGCVGVYNGRVERVPD